MSMKIKLFGISLSAFVSVTSFAGEYEKVYSCLEALKGEQEISNKFIARDLFLLASKHTKTEGVNLFSKTDTYFCSLPQPLDKKNTEQKSYRLKIDIPKHKVLFISYQKSVSDAQSFAASHFNENRLPRDEMLKLKTTRCGSQQKDPRSQKILVDFLRARIAQVHSNHSYDSPVESLKLCGKSFLLKTSVDHELAKFSKKPEGGHGETSDQVDDNIRFPSSSNR